LALFSSFLSYSIAKRRFTIEDLALIALGSPGNASLGRREGSRSSLQGVFAEVKPRQKRLTSSLVNGCFLYKKAAQTLLFY
jgi:hypothetical protein